MDAEQEWAGLELGLSLEDRRVLLASEFGAGLRPRDVARLMGGLDGTPGARLVTHPAGEVLARAGERQRAFFVVLAGRLEVVRRRPEGARHILDVIEPGGACGAVTMFAERPRWPADVEAAGDVRLLAVPGASLLADGEPGRTRQRLLQNCVRLLAGRARHLNARGELLARRGLRERLAFYLVRHADAGGRVAGGLTRQALADHLGVSRASMTRELGRMADEGLIAISGRRFAILDAAELRRLAE